MQHTFEMCSARSGPDPAKLSPKFDKSNPIPARQIACCQGGSSTDRGVESRACRPTRFRIGVKQQHHIRVALLMVLGNVQASDPQRGRPIDVPNSITGYEWPDTGGLEALSHSRRDIIAERGAWPQRAWQLPHRNSRRKDLNVKTAVRFGFPNCQARVVSEAQMQVAQLAATPRQRAQTKSSLQWSAGEEPDDNPIASTGERHV